MRKVLKFSEDASEMALMVDLIKSVGAEAFKKMFGNSPQLLALLDAKFGGDEHEELRCQLLEYVDNSDYSLRQWIESLRNLQVWLDTRGLEMSTEDELGYISCAGESAGAGSNLSHLPSLVTDMLETYGCERAVRRAAND
jgi:hypothetical protein